MANQEELVPRRDFFRIALAASSVSVPAAVLAMHEVKPENKVTMHWIHGNRAGMYGGTEYDLVQGGACLVRGKSFSTLAIYFDLSLPVDAVVQAIWLRLRTQQGAKISSLAVYDCEHLLARVDVALLQSSDWNDLRVELPHLCKVQRSLSLTLECAFEGTERQLCIGAVACEMPEFARIN
jgi:hypothetical protein